MIKKTLIAAFLISSISAEAVINLNKYRKSSYFGAYSSFDRDHLIRYRGVGPELTPPQAIKAMLGDKASGMKSMLTEAIRMRLMGQTIPFVSLVSNYFSADLNQMINDAISANGGEYLNYTNASLTAYDIAEENFYNKYSSSEIEQYFLDYNSPLYYDYPNDPREVVFTTAYMEIAANYSSHLAVIQEKEEKSIDLNYFNYVKNSKWIRKVKPWPDKGEFITANYVPAEDITGYEIRRNFTKDFVTYHPPGNNLHIAFYKVIENGEPYVLIIDGNNEVGIHKSGNRFTYAISTIDPNIDVPNTLSSNNNDVEVLGIIKLCPVDNDCKSPTSLLKKYNVQERKGIYSYYQRQIEKITVADMQAKIFFHDRAITKEHKTTYIPPVVIPKPVVKQTDLEYTKSVANIDIKKDKHLNVINHLEFTNKTPNSLEYILDNEVKLSAGDSFYFSIPEAYHALEIDFIELDHYKLNDDDYATISVQFFHEGDVNWKTSGRLGRKGKLKSPTDIAPKLTTLDGWEKDQHRKFPRGYRSKNPLTAKVARIMSIGSKNNFVKRFKIIFKGTAK